MLDRIDCQHLVHRTSLNHEHVTVLTGDQ
ncbi:uncharacterized protein METZ01_LOCUS137373, partial [marine metagenome]